MNKGRIAIVVAIMLGIIALGHLAVYETLVHLWDFSGPLLFKLKIVFAVLTLSFIVMTMITMAVYSKIGGWLYILSAVWLGTVYWLFLGSVVASLALFVSAGIARACFLLGLAISLGGIINANRTRVTRYTVALPNLPEHWQGKKIAMISDLHLGNVRGLPFAQKIVRMIQKESPELVLVAGDFYDGPPAPYVKLASPLATITAPKGVYFAEGNHEEFSNSAKYLDALRSAGVHVLVNEKTVVDGIEIIGINYNASLGDKATAAILGTIGVDRDMPSILIKHAPTGLNAGAAAGINLQVSGHAHRGQVWPGMLLTKKIFKEFEYGMHTLGSMTVVTSSGAGTWGPPQRVGTHGEIVVLTIIKK